MARLRYQLSFKGVASETLRAAFDEFELDPGTGVTVVRCPYDSLRRALALVEELGLELIEVRLLVSDP